MSDLNNLIKWYNIDVDFFDSGPMPPSNIRVNVEHKLSPTLLHATSLNLLALSWLFGSIVQFV